MDKYFRTPASQRPAADLNLTPITETLPEDFQRINTGVTRWFDIIMGFGLDGAGNQGIQPQQVAKSLAVGNLLMRVAFFEKNRDDQLPSAKELEEMSVTRALYLGTIDALDDSLTVSGGYPEGLPWAMTYLRVEDDTYLPARAQDVGYPMPNGEQEVHAVDLPDPYRFLPQIEMITLPHELQAVHALGTMASGALTNIDLGAIAPRGKVEIAGH